MNRRRGGARAAAAAVVAAAVSAALALGWALATGLATPAAADRMTAGLSSHLVGITSSFSGAEVMVFGAIERDLRRGAAQRRHVVVTVTGPRGRAEVRRKSRVAGVWVNADSAEFDNAPRYYAVLSTYPLNAIADERTLRRYEIGVAHLDLTMVDPPADKAAAAAFRAALLRARLGSGHYVQGETAVRFLSDILFRTSSALPADTPVGEYRVRVFLFQGGEVTSSYEAPLIVTKTGLERNIYVFAHRWPWSYGLLAVTIAAFAGWGGAVMFRRR